MNKAKRIYSILLILSFVMSMLVIPVGAAASVGENDILVADFSSDATAISTFKFTKDTETTYNGAAMSGKWLTSGRTDNGPSGKLYFNTDNSAVDLTGMEKVHIIMNNEKNVGNKINVLFYSTGDTYFNMQLDLDWEGWKELVIPMSEFGGKNGTWDNVIFVTFNQGGWSAPIKEHSPVYFDSIWLEAKPVPETVELANPDTLTKIKDVFTADSEHKRLYDKTAKWSGKELELVFDASEYYIPNQQYISSWIYSEEATGEEIDVMLLNASDGSYVENSFEVNWQGWKLISLATADFSGSGRLASSNTYKLNSASSTLYFDRIWFSAKKPATMQGSDVYAWGGVVPNKNARIRIENTAAVAGTVKNAISIKEGEEEFTDFTASAVGNIISITIPELAKGKKYSLSLNAGAMSKDGVEFADIIPIEFYAGNIGSSSGNITYTQGSKITAKAELSPETGDELTLVAASYKGDKIVQVLSKTGNGAVATEAFDMSKAENIKAWVISEKYGVIKSGARPERYEDVLNHQSVMGTKSFSLNGVYQSGEGFVLDMSYIGGRRKAVAVIYKEGEIIAADEVFVSQDTYHTIKLGDTELEQGEYDVMVSLLGENKAVFEKAYYILPDEEARILSLVNDSKSEDEVLKLFGDYPALFRVNNITDEKLLAHIALFVFENKTYQSFDEVHNAVNRAKTALSQLNKTDWTELDGYFGKYPEALGNSEAYDKLNDFSESERANLLKAVSQSMPFASFEDVRNTILAVINEYEKTGRIEGMAPSKVSGNSDEEGREYKAQYDKEKEKEPDEFTDLENVSWATDSIYTLLEKGIITMPSNGLYRPGDSITRAEFVTLLVKAMGLDVTDKSSVFTDVDERAWYAPYFTAAKAVGVVSGYADGSVGALETIKRQDIAVMVIRALDALGIEFTKTNENVGISDSDSISDYAKDAVTAVMEYGIMSGMGNGEFSPLGITGRAQAAVVIERLITGIENGGVIGGEAKTSGASDILSMPELVLIKNIGIIAEDDSVINQSAVTRRELARALYNIEKAGNDTESLYESITFTDVPANDPDIISIAAACSLGYMTAKNNEFKPDEPIDIYELFAALVKLLGYEFMAEYMGGYPVGYMNVASNIGLNKKVSLDGEKTINNEEFINAIFNALNAAPAEFSGVSEGSFVGYTVNPESTLLYTKYNIYKLEGVLEGDMYSDILSKTPRASKGDIIIAGKAYNTKLTDINKLVGYMTESYITEETDEVVAIFGIDTTETVILNEDYTLTDSRFTFETESGSKKHIDFAKSISLLYNGRLTPFDKKLFEDINGYISLIDYDEDRKADVVKLYNYSIMQVNSVSVASGIITDSLGGKGLNIGKLVEGEEYLIYKNGKRATLSDIKVNDIISYTEQASPKLITINVSDKSVEGMAESIDDKKAVISGEEYYIIEEAKSRISQGQEVKFHLDFLGRIAAASTTLDMVYGYLHRIYEDEETLTVYMKIFTENNRWVELPLTERVKLNEDKVEAHEVYTFFGQDPLTYRQLIRYNVTDDAEICKVFTAKEYKAWSEEEREAMAKDSFRLSERAVNPKYRPNNTSFTDTMAVSANTKIFLVPKAAEKVSAEDYYIINSSVLIGNKAYNEVISYNASETFVADALVIKDTVENVFKISNSASIQPMMVVTKVNKVLNKDDELAWFVEGSYNGAEKFGLATKNLTDIPEIAELKKGDVIQPSMDRDGFLVGINTVYQAEKGFKQYMDSASAYGTDVTLAGEVLSVDSINNRLVIKTNATGKGISATLAGNIRPLIYDTLDNTVTVGTKEDILKGDMIVFMARYLVATQMVIFR